MKPIANCGLRNADSKRKRTEGVADCRLRVADSDRISVAIGGAMTAEELAGALQISVRMVRKLKHEGKIPYMRIGRLVRFDYDAVTKALTSDAGPIRSQQPGGEIGKADTSPQSSPRSGAEGGTR